MTISLSCLFAFDYMNQIGSCSTRTCNYKFFNERKYPPITTIFIYKLVTSVTVVVVSCPREDKTTGITIVGSERVVRP